MSAIEIPILRLGVPYQSMDTQELSLGDDGVLVTHVANPGLIRRDLLGIAKSRAALQEYSTDTLAGFCEIAADLFLTGDLPTGNGRQGPEDFVRALSQLTGLPHSLCRNNMRKVHAAMANIRTVLSGLTRGLPLEIFDTGYARQDAIEMNYFVVTNALGVVLPSNSPGVNSLWLPAPVLKVPVLLKPGREDPLTPYRIVQSLIAAGFPPEAFGFYPTTHEGGDTILFSCDRGIMFGNDATVKKYESHPGIQVHGSGRSKVLIGDDFIGTWEGHVGVLAESIGANGGRSCINASSVLVPSSRAEVADGLARELARIEPLQRDHPDAVLCGFANPEFAMAINDQIEGLLKEPGAEDVTARYRKGPRLVKMHGQTFLQPTVIECSDPEHPLANTEYMFPYASVVERPQVDMPGAIGESLVVSALTADPAWSRELMNNPHIERLNLGSFPTNRVQWEQPHEGNLFEFLYRRRAIQGNMEALAQ